MLLLVVRYLAI